MLWQGCTWQTCQWLRIHQGESNGRERKFPVMTFNEAKGRRQRTANLISSKGIPMVEYVSRIPWAPPSKYFLRRLNSLFCFLSLKDEFLQNLLCFKFFLLIFLIENLFSTLYSDSSFPPLLLSVPSYWPPRLIWATSFATGSLESSHRKNNIRLKYNTIRWNKNKQVRTGQKNQTKEKHERQCRKTHVHTHRNFIKTQKRKPWCIYTGPARI